MNSGIKASQAGTQLRAALTNLAKPTDKQAAMMDKLGLSLTKENGEMKSLMEVMKMLREKMKSLTDEEKQASIETLTGVSTKQAAKEAMKGLTQEQIKNKTALELGLEAIKKYDVEQLNSALYKQYSKKELKDMTEEQKRNIVAMQQGKVAMEGLSKAEQTKAAATVFGKEAMSGWLAIINSSEEDFKKLTKEIYNAEGAADEMAETMLDNLQGSFTLLQSAVEGVKNQIGEGLAPYLRKFADWLTSKMPDLQQDVAEFFKSFDEKAEGFMQTVDEMTAMDEWKYGSLFDKIDIAWDKLIAEPFSEWWESTGKALFAEKANDIGRGIGSGLSNLLQALLGIDLSTTLKEGESVGGAFAKGFIDGFDLQGIKSKFGEATKGIFSNAASILPGGKEADLSSWLSAALIAKIGIPLVGMGMKGVKFGKSIFGNTTVPNPEGGGSPVIVPGIGRRILGSASMGTGVLGFGANTAIKLGAGNLAGGASLSAGALSAIGLGSVAGGLAGGATLISAIKDFNRGLKSDNKEEAKAYKESAAWKGGGVTAGASIGAGIGAWFGGVGAIPGALIGAGVGGIGGWIKGNKVKDDYEEKVTATKEAAKAEKILREQEKYESKNVKEAIASGDAEEFQRQLQISVAEKLQDSFGNIKLSMEEIQDTAKKIVFDTQIESANKFSDATNSAKDSFISLQEASSTMEKLNWKAGLGIKFSDEDKESYQKGIEDYMKNAKKYIEDKHYEATMAIGLLVDGSPVDMTSGLDKMYTSMQKKIKNLSKNLSEKTTIALQDGVISLSEEKEITNIQNQISEITEKISNAETDAKFETLGIKYAGIKLDIDSFSQLQSEMKNQTEVLNGNYDDALEIGISNLNLQLSEKAINQEQYDAQLQKLTEGYYGKIKDLQVRVEGFQFDAIAQAFNGELDDILPQFSGTLSERLSQAMHTAIKSGVDVTSWDTDTAIKWLGLDGIDGTTQEAIAQMVSMIASTLPEADFSPVSSALSKNLGSSVENGINSIKLPDGLGIIPKISNSISEAMEGVSLLPIINGVETKLSSGAKGASFASVAASIGSGVGSAITGINMSPINEAIGQLREKTGNKVNSVFNKGFNTSTNVKIHANYTLDNPIAKLTFSGGGSGTATVRGSVYSGENAKKNANGSIVNGPILSWIGEDGPEAIIPLGSKRRGRGLSLWAQAGEMLGVRKYAEGGIIHTPNEVNPMTESPMYDYLNETNENYLSNEEESMGTVVTNSNEKKETSNQFDIQVNMNPVFQIDGNKNEASILNLIQATVPGMADEIAGVIAGKLQEHFSNMPQEA